jgi:hypothetical protein
VNGVFAVDLRNALLHAGDKNNTGSGPQGTRAPNPSVMVSGVQSMQSQRPGLTQSTFDQAFDKKEKTGFDHKDLQKKLTNEAWQMHLKETGEKIGQGAGNENANGNGNEEELIGGMGNNVQANANENFVNYLNAAGDAEANRRHRNYILSKNHNYAELTMHELLHCSTTPTSTFQGVAHCPLCLSLLKIYLGPHPHTRNLIIHSLKWKLCVV